MSSLSTTSSWVVVRISDNQPILETFNPEVVSALNMEKYKAIPIYDWLASINRRIKEGTL